MNTELEREALLAIDQLEDRVRQLEHERTEPIAIVGIACRFPGCDDPEAFWDLLARGEDVFGEQVADGGIGNCGLIRTLDRFDSDFFRISPREALRMDPRQRLLLELAWEALENAGMLPFALQEPQVGVYVGLSGNGHAPVLLGHQPDTYNVTGTVGGVSAGRISFFLGLRGPSVAIDTTCSSSLVAVHMGCRALRARECKLAIVGGVGIIPRSPAEQEWWTELGHLSRSGRCRSFDASGDGVVGSDGCGAIVLKRLSAALADGDRIAAVIRGTAINHDGSSQGLTVPSAVAQEEVISRALGDAGVTPDEIDYVECHGTGTPLGDPIEVQALGQVFGDGRMRHRPVLLGSVKSNIGHTDAAAGLAGLIKVVLSLEHERIPKSLHFETPNPHIPWSTLPVRVASESVEWRRGARPRRAGVSSFGLSGTNAHVVVEEAPADAPDRAAPARGAEPVVLSARSEAALSAVAGRLRGLLTRHGAEPGLAELKLGDVAYSLATARTHHEHRVAVTATTLGELTAALEVVERGETPAGAWRAQVAGMGGGVAWLLTGQGAQTPGMGRGLYAKWPVFREALDAAFAAFAAASPDGTQLREVMWGTDSQLLEQTGWSQRGLFALEWALAALWRSWGMEPDYVCGHSIGELSAAAIAGVVSLQDGARLVSARARLMQALPAGGGMVAVDASETDVLAALQAHGTALSIAAVNGPGSVVLSGKLEALEAVVKDLARQGIRSRRLSVSHAFHSQLMTPMLDDFRRVAETITFHAPSLLLVSNLTGELADDKIAGAEYWVRHVREAVRFGDGLRTLHARGVDTYIELGPRPTLLGLVPACLPNDAEPGLLASLRPELPDDVAMLSALGRCHVRGRKVTWSAVFPDGGRRIDLPSYPWQRERHWIDLIGNQQAKGRDSGESISDAIYQLAWTETIAPQRSQLAGRWLIVGDGGAAAAVVAELEPSRASFEYVTPDALAAALPADHVVCLWSGREAAMDGEDALQMTIVALQIVQTLAAQSQSPRLWWMTCGAVGAGETASVPPAAAAVWGLGRVVQQERPELRCSLIEVGSFDHAADVLSREFGASDDEPQVLWRAGQRLVPRLVRASPREKADFCFATDGTVLITGGLGGLGLKVARRLVDRGVKQLLLTSRRGLETPGAMEAVQELEALGANVTVAAADIAEGDAVARLIAEIPAQHPLRGVVHAAGIIDRGLLTEQTPARVEAVMSPKVLGAWNLHQVTQALDLDFFVLFSSVSGTLGLGGLGPYAAANVYLDAIASWRHAQGLPAQSLSWGPWSDVGMALSHQVRVAPRGLMALTPAEGMALFEQAIVRPDPQLVVANFDLSAVAKSFGDVVPAPWRSLVRVDAALPAKGTWKKELASLPPKQRLDAVRRVVRTELERVLSRASEQIALDRPLRELGLDSLMALELRNGLARRFEKSFPVTLAFDYPTVDAIALHVVDELVVSTEVAAAEASGVIRTDFVADDPIAIVGVGCRYPGGASDPESFWRLLDEGVDAVSEVPPERWEADAWYDPDPDAAGKMTSRWGGFVRDLEAFDPGFFGLSALEAKSVDPQERMLLETAWEAIEHAGLTADSLMGSDTGVYMGLSSTEYQMRVCNNLERLGSYALLGTAHSSMIGRLSYWLGLKGPNLPVDTACSSSLVAVHLACQALRCGECSLALAGGANVVLDPQGAVYFSRLRALSPTGRCHSFGAAADGYVRSEGAGVVVLERLSDAQRRGHRVLAVIRGSAVNQDGRSSGVTAPNGPSQQMVIREALRRGSVDPASVGYLECHGTGTPLGDPIEVLAAAAVLGEGREEPLILGSVKSNIGHPEAAAGLAGLIKVVLSLEHERIPKSLHFETPNPHIPWSTLPVRVASESVEWRRGARPRRAGVSSFGLSGTNAHVVVEEAPADAPDRAAPARGAEPVVLSARSEAALSAVAGRLRGLLTRHGAEPGLAELKLGDVAYSLATARTHHEHRVAVTAATLGELTAALEVVERGETPAGAWRAQVAGMGGGVAWLLTGQGAQTPGMGRGLYAKWPVFREALDAAFAAFAAASPDGTQLREVMWGTDSQLLEQTGWSQRGLFALEWALAALWRSWGMEPDYVCGHSIGELSAAAIAGVVSLQDGARLVSARARLMQALPAGGGMVAVDASETDVLAALQAHGTALSIAAVNGPGSVVLSGKLEALEAVVKDLARQGIRSRRLSVSHAFHSQLMTPMLDDFRRVAETITFHAPSLLLVSNLTGELADDKIAGAEYWVRHVREAVRFGDGLRTLHARGVDTYIELGPRPTLLGLVPACLPNDAEPGLLASLRPELPDDVAMLSALGRCHVRGRRVTWSAVFPDGGRRIDLPSYPWQRERHWIDLIGNQQAKGRDSGHPLLGIRIASAGADAVYDTILSLSGHPWLADHRLGERVIVPGTGVAELARAAAENHLDDAPQVRNLVLQTPLVLEGDKARRVQVVISKGGTCASVYSQPVDHSGNDWTLHAVADIGLRPAAVSAVVDVAALRGRCGRTVDVTALYEEFAAAGLHYGPAFRGVRSLVSGADEALGQVSLPADIDARGYGVHPALLDAALHVMAGAAPADGAAWVPFEIGQLVVYHTERREALVHARLAPGASTDAPVLDITLMDGTGLVVAELSSLRCLRADTLLRQDETLSDARYQLSWTASVPADRTVPVGRWLVVSEDEAMASAFVAGLQASQASYQWVPPNAVAAALPADHVVCLWPSNAADVDGERALQITTAALGVVQALARQHAPPRLWWTTCAAVAVGDSAVGCPAAAAIWGLGRTVQQERPDLHCTLIDVEAISHAGEALERELGAPDDEPQIVWRAGQRLVARLVRARAGMPHADAGNYQLIARDKGTLDSLAVVAASRRQPRAGEVEIEICASGLNFRDVLNALGKYPGEAGALGSECAGVVVTVGADVSSVVCGDTVMGFVPGGAFRRYVTADARLIAPIPKGLSFEEAATIPLVFLTAWYALHDLGRLKRGERLLVHAAAGGVGMAAVQIGQWLGATILGTASASKWDVVRSQGVMHVANSRDAGFAAVFRDAVGGADVVLNALTGDIVDASLSLLGPSGRFLEMGKIGLRTPEDVQAAYPGVLYRAFDLTEAGPDRIAEMLAELVRGFEAGHLRPLPVRVFPIARSEDAFRFMAQARHIGKIALRPATLPRMDGTVLITGGLGGLGLQVAHWLVDRGVKALVLTGRRGLETPGAREAVRKLEERGASVTVAAADIADRDALATLLAAIPEQRPLRGVVHAAGTLDDGLLTEQTPARFAAVMSPKVQGAWNLHQATQSLKLDFFVLFSSTSGTLGSSGQGAYAAANVYLDALASWRVAKGLPAASLAWGPWSEIGMADRLDPTIKKRMARDGVIALAPSRAVALLEQAILTAEPQIVLAAFDLRAIARAPSHALSPIWRGLIASSPTTKAASSVWFNELQSLDPDARSRAILTVVRAEAARALALNGPEAIPVDQPFKDIGLDSLMSVELRNALNKRAKAALPATVAFDYPTATALAAHLMETMFGRAPSATTDVPAPSMSAQPVLNTGEAAAQFAIVGIGCRYPGGVNDAETFWRLLEEGRDAIGEVPGDRWNIDTLYDDDPTAPDKVYTRRGGFVEDVDLFDARFFGISAREAASLDPQQRFLLEVTWEAFANANQPVEALRGAPVGVFVGICGNEYGDLLRSANSQTDSFTATGNALSVAPGRVSYTFGFEGPSIAVDTACSSSLVAVHLACQSLRAGECDIAVAAGVNLMLTPGPTLSFCRLRALSVRGRCSAFDAEADGYVRAEGCSAIVLKRLEDAERAGDRILAVIRGSAVNHDGRSNGLTAPSRRAQEAVIRRAHRQAGIRPADVVYVEAHGTGTPLGDSMELQALGAVMAEDRAGRDPLLVGSVKTNFGHAEAAAGLAGLIKVVLSLSQSFIPKSLHFRTPSPHVPWSDLPVRVVSEPTAWPLASNRRIAGVSSFGIGGTNAHVVVSAPLDRASPATVPESGDEELIMLPVSAKTPAALSAVAANYDHFLGRTPSASIADVAYTAATGRTHFRHRAAVLASSRQDMRRQLTALAARTEGDRATRGRPGQGPSRPSAGRATERSSAKQPRVMICAPDILLVPSSLAANLRRHPVVEAALRDCEAASASLLDRSLAEISQGDPAQPLPGKEGAVARFAVQFALGRLWHALGIVDEACGEAGDVVAAINGQVPLREALLTAVAKVERKPGRAGDGLESLLASALERGVDAVVVLGPPGGLSAIETSGRQAGVPCLPSLGEPGDGSDWTAMMHSLAELYVLGANVNWKVLHAAHARRQIVLPPYPWQRVRFWPVSNVAKPMQTVITPESKDMREKSLTLEPDL